MPPRRSARTGVARTWGCGCGLVAGSLVVVLVLLAGTAIVRTLNLGPAIQSGPDDILGIDQPASVPWADPQPRTGIDISFPQCGRTLRDLARGYVIVGLDGGMPDRPNPCFAEQWAFALRQAGAAVYVNTSDNGRGDPTTLGRRNARADLVALRRHDIETGTPVWLDVELTEVWRGSQARHRAVIAEHLRVLAEAGYPVGVYSAPALWREITGGARLDVPTWVGIGRASAGRAELTCGSRSFGARRPSIVQRIGSGSDGRPLDRNLTCPGVDLDGLVRPL
jgi:hypothetical protein